jgi:DedD protein
MAFFKFRLPGQPTSEPQGNTSNTPAESVDAMRRRARHRLIGASVLVVLGVVGFPVLFDTQPRPVSVDIAVDIPDRASAKPLVDTTKQKPLSAAAGLDAKEEVVPDVKPEIKAEAKPEPKVEAKPEPKVEAKPEPKAEVKLEPKVEAKPEPKAEPELKSEAKPKLEPARAVKTPEPAAMDMLKAINGKPMIEAAQWAAKNLPDPDQKVIAQRVVVKLRQLQDLGADLQPINDLLAP